MKTGARSRPSRAIVLARLFALLLVGCGAAAPVSGPTATSAPPGTVVSDLRPRFFFSRAELGPLAPLLDTSLDLEGRVLVLAGAELPAHASRVSAREVPAGATAAISAAVAAADGAGAPGESVVASYADGHLVLTYTHDVNQTGWCCSGMVMIDWEDCGDDDLPPPTVATSDDVVVAFFVVPADAVDGVTTARATTPCVRP